LENESFNLNLRKGKLEINAFIEGNAQLLSTTINRMKRSAYDLSGSSQLLQNGMRQFRRSGDQSELWQIEKLHQLNTTLKLQEPFGFYRSSV